MKLSEIFGRKILDKAGKEGYVLSAGTSGGSLYLSCADENEREFYVKWENVLLLGDSLIYEEREENVENFYALRLGRACYDLKGNFEGRLEDCTVLGGRIKTARIGKKNYPAGILVWGDIILIKELRRLNCDVIKDGKRVFKKGAVITDELLSEAAAAGEYVQTTLKSL